MLTWINFWTFFFWLSLTSFLINPTNFISLLFYSEAIWIILYCCSVLMGGINDDLTLFSISFFLLGLAGLEFSIGFLLIISFKNFNMNLSFYDDVKIWNQFLKAKTNKLNLSKYVWKK